MKNLDDEAEEHIQSITGPYILTLWHGRIFYLFYYLRNRLLLVRKKLGRPGVMKAVAASMSDSLCKLTQHEKISF